MDTAGWYDSYERCEVAHEWRTQGHVGTMVDEKDSLLWPIPVTPNSSSVTPPDSLDEWNAEGMTTRPRTDITLQRGIVPGAKVWMTAYWYNPRGACGPAAKPKSTCVQCPTMWFAKQRELRTAA